MNKLSFKITQIAKPLSSFSGLHLADELFDKFDVRKFFGSILPKKNRQRGFSSIEKFSTLIFGFIAGAQSLDDFNWYAQDPMFQKISPCPNAITLGKFLRSFNRRQIEHAQQTLSSFSWGIRKFLAPQKKEIIFTMDATMHEQFAQKMEGVEVSYKKIRCLSSQNIFDEFGLCYGMRLRSGGTHSHVHAEEFIEQALSEAPKDLQKYFRADSAYASFSIYNLLLNCNTKFTICLSENIWSLLLESNRSFIKWAPTNLSFFDSSDCEVANLIYSSKKLGKQKFLRVVMIRTRKKTLQKEDNHHFHYYAVVTNITEGEMSAEKVLKFYRKRSNVENYIKDLKQGMDFYHFPCQSLKANNVWGLCGVIAYNLMRVMAYCLFPKTGCFVNTTRRRLIQIAGIVIRHARHIEIRMQFFLAKEVERIKSMMNRSILDRDEKSLSNYS